MEAIKELRKMGACQEAIDWLKTQPDWKTAWSTCERGDWMLWLLGSLSGSPRTNSRHKLVLTTCQCARLALPYVAKDEGKSLEAIKTAEAWANRTKRITLQDVRKAAAAAYAAAAATASYAAATASYAAAYAAYAATASYAAATASYAAAYAAYAAATRKCASIVRENYPQAPKLKVK